MFGVLSCGIIDHVANLVQTFSIKKNPNINGMEFKLLIIYKYTHIVENNIKLLK